MRNNIHEFIFKLPLKQTLGAVLIVFAALMANPLAGEASFVSFWKGFFHLEKKVDAESPKTLKISLQDAIQFALKNNLLMHLAYEGIRESKGERLQAVSELLPHIEAGIFQQRVGRENLAAMGFKGLSMIGPFNTFDARFQLTQKIFDLSAISRFQASRMNVKIKRFEEEFARQKVVMP